MQSVQLATFGVWELVIILAIVLLIFGAGKLPQLGESLGKGIRNFRKSFKDEPKQVEGEAERVDEDEPVAGQAERLEEGKPPEQLPASQQEQPAEVREDKVDSPVENR
mgnify:CR=1 FL=1